MNATWSWLTNRWTSLRGSPISARPSWIARDVVAAGSEQELRRIVALVEVGAPDGAAAVEALEVQPRRAEVPQRALLGVRAKRRAVGRDVVGDELADERPAGRDGRVVCRPLPRRRSRRTRLRPTPIMCRKRLVGRERRQVGEHPAVAPAVDRRVDDPVRRQAVVARQHRLRTDRRHAGWYARAVARRYSPSASRSASASGSPASRISAWVASTSYGTAPEMGVRPVEVDQQVRGARIAVARLADRAGVEEPATLGELDLAAALREPARERRRRSRAAGRSGCGCGRRARAAPWSARARRARPAR